MAASDRIVRWRYRFVPDHLLGEILTKRWVDTAIPLLILLAVVAVFGSLIPDFFGASSISDLMRQWGEFSLVVLALMIVMVAGGIDLSVGSTFALGNIVALALLSVAEWPPAGRGSGDDGVRRGCRPGERLAHRLSAPACLPHHARDADHCRAVVDMLLLKYSVAIAAAFPDSDLWYYFGEGFVLGVPFSVVVAVVARHRRASGAEPDAGRLACACGRRLAPLRAQCRHTGAAGDLPHLCPVGHACAHWPALLFASRLGGAGADTGIGLEDRGADGSGARRQQPRRRPRLGGQGDHRLDHGDDHGQRPGAPRRHQRGQFAAARHGAAGGRGDRRALAEEPAQIPVEGLCVANLCRRCRPRQRRMAIRPMR